MKIFKYKIFCETDQKWEFSYLDEAAPAPDKCPIDTNHLCDLNTIAVDQIIDYSVQQVEVTKTPNPHPFAEPSFRTKRKGSPSFSTITPGMETTIDFQLTEERYVHGGIVVFENMRVGDTITGEIVDKDGVIPVEVRDSVCESWPIVASYIDTEPLPPGNSYRELNTYPLNAKISPGLYLRVTIKTKPKGDPREVGIGYYLTKKL